jgi:hypothetical protein
MSARLRARLSDENRTVQIATASSYALSNERAGLSLSS